MRAHACNRCVRPQMPTVQPTCTCAAPCLSPVCDQRPRPARETIRVMRAADAKENCMQRFSPPSLDHHVDVDQHCTRQRELGCAAVVAMAKRHEATRSQGDEPGKRGSASASSCSERTATERGARKEPTKATQRRVAPSTRRALYETTTSVTEAFCSRSAPIKRASAFCCILPLGVSRVACFHERQPALFFFGCRSANRPSEGSTKLSNGR